ncbi:radical SAM protein [Bengtsoniella intestinalis]|uniref:radical SAM protein n=1 Tax=Bengtsoniella intestinalis TaxID=3073143 RepID=UPI00391EFDBE
MNQIYEKLANHIPLTYEDAVTMLDVELFGVAYYTILQQANQYARKTFHNTGTIFAQIGIDCAPCSVNCQFCRLAVDNFGQTEQTCMPVESIVERAVCATQDGANEVFIMCTAEYHKDDFLTIGKAVRAATPPDTRLVANVDDFDVAYGQKLKDAGFTGVYHICRLGEGVVTQATVEKRIATLDAIKESGLELYYCVEPIGPEHTGEEIATEIFRAKDYDVNVMAVMRRICFEGSPLAQHGEITAVKLALICAVSTLCVKPNRAMGVHEPEIISLLSGANQIYAEAGSNPRDTAIQTEQSRGFSVKDAQKMLIDAQWNL